MECEKCKDSGVILDEESMKLPPQKNESHAMYIKRMSDSAKHCDCLFGQQMMFIHKKADQMAKKRIAAEGCG